MPRVLVPVDGSEESEDALRYAFGLFPDAEIHVLNVIQVTEFPAEAGASPVQLAEEYAADVIDTMEEIASTNDREILTHRTHGNASKCINSYVEDHDIDHIVLGSKGRSGLSRVLLGSVAESVMRRSTVPVTVVR